MHRQVCEDLIIRKNLARGILLGKFLFLFCVLFCWMFSLLAMACAANLEFVWLVAMNPNVFFVLFMLWSFHLFESVMFHCHLWSSDGFGPVGACGLWWFIGILCLVIYAYSVQSSLYMVYYFLYIRIVVYLVYSYICLFVYMHPRIYVCRITPHRVETIQYARAFISGIDRNMWLFSRQ